MIQLGTKLSVLDNSGARTVRCIRVFPGFKRRYANMGDIVLVSVIKLRSKRREFVKVKKGELYRALIVKVRVPIKDFSGDSFCYVGNSAVVLFNKQNKFLGTRILSSISYIFRYTKYLKIISVSYGTLF